MKNNKIDYQPIYDHDKTLQQLIEAREATTGQPKHADLRRSIKSAIAERKRKLRK